MAVSIHGYTGRFDIISGKKEFRLSISTPYGSAAAFFDEDNGLGKESCVEDVINAIESRLGEFLYISSREETLRAISDIRAHLTECEIEQQRNVLAIKRAAFERAQSDLRLAESVMSMLERDLAGAEK